MGSSKKQTVGYKYFMGLHFGVCQGPVDALLRIMVGDRVAWRGEQTANGTIVVDAPELFGGEEREGGVDGQLDVMMGGEAQTANAYLTSVQGSLQPAYRGLLSAVFRRGLVSANNPYLKPWAFTVRRIVAGWYGGSAWYPEKAAIDVVASWEPVNFSIQAGVAGAQYVLSGGFSAADTIAITKPPGLTYQAWSRWSTDSASTAYGLPWHNDFWVEDSAGATRFYWSGALDPVTKDPALRFPNPAAAEAAFSSSAIYLTGSSSYKFTISNHAPINDDRGGLSLRARKVPVLAMNPAHIVYQCLTDPEWGMGYSPTIINDASFRAAADTFHAEGMGLCLHWTQQQTIDAFVQAVMDHAGAVLRQNPRTGLFEIKALRGDYVVGSLPLLDESNIRSLESFDRAGPAEAVNEVTVRFDDAATGKTGSVTLQNLAAVEAVGGPVARSVAYPGLPTPELAARVAMRDLRVLSTPLARVRLRMNRQGYSILPGDVVRLAWPKLGIAQLVLRVARVNTGALTDGAIEIEAVEDVFGLGASVYVAQQPVAWQPPDTAPTPIVMRAVIEAPYYELQRQLSAADLSVLAADAGYLLVGAARPSGSAVRFTIADRTAGVGEYEEAGAGDFCAAGTLAASLGYAATSVVLSAPSDPGLIETGTYALIGPEIVRVDAWDPGTSTLTIGRGVLDTVAASHAAGATILFLGAVNASDGVERVGGEAVDVKLLTVAGSGTLGESLASADTVTFASRAARPYPPGRLRINGLAYPASVESPVEISWAHRNRLQQNLEGDESNNIGPEGGTTYSARLLAAVTEIPIESSSGMSGTSWSVTPTIGAGDYIVELWSVRGALQSLQSHRVPLTISGSAFDPSFSNVILLLHFEGADNSTAFIDSGPLSLMLSAAGNARIRTDHARFGLSSGFFDGSGDRVSFPSAASFNFASVDFTIEAFIRPTNNATESAIVCKWRNTVNSDLGWFFGVRPSGRLFFLFTVSGAYEPSNDTQSATGVISYNTWQHVAVVRDGSNLRGFVNGVQVFSRSIGTSVFFSSSQAQVVGDVVDGLRPYTGHIDELRITRGLARYTANFAPPATQFPDSGASGAAAGRLLAAAASLIPGVATNGNATAPGDPGGLPLFIAPASLQRGAAYNDLPASTLLLLHMDGTNGSTTFSDSSTYAHSIAAARSAAITTADKIAGTGALAMPGDGATNTDGDFLTVGTAGTRPTQFASMFAGTDWTVEGWAKIQSGGGFATGAEVFTIGRRDGSLTFFGISLAFRPFSSPSNAPSFSIGVNGSVRQYSGTTAAPLDEWFHFAVVSTNGGQVRCYVNGQNPASFFVGASPTPQDYITLVESTDGAMNPRVGGYTGPRNCKIDELRVLNYARYTSDFTPPTPPFPNP